MPEITGKRVASIAGRVLKKMKGVTAVRLYSGACSDRYAGSIKPSEIRALAASALTQHEPEKGKKRS
jgi:hypothetical protein